MLSEGQNRVVLDVADVVPNGIIGALVGPEELATLLADTNLVLAMNTNEAYPVAGDSAPVAYAGLPGQTFFRPLIPVHVREVTAHPALSLGKILVVPLRELCSGRLYAGDHVVQEVEVPVHVRWVVFHEAEAHVRGEIGGGMSDAPDALPGMDLLYDPSRVLLEELLGLQEAVAEDMEMGGQLSEVLPLAPGMEDRHPRLAADGHNRIVDKPLEDVEVLVGPHHALG